MANHHQGLTPTNPPLFLLDGQGRLIQLPQVVQTIKPNNKQRSCCSLCQCPFGSHRFRLGGHRSKCCSGSCDCHKDFSKEQTRLWAAVDFIRGRDLLRDLPQEGSCCGRCYSVLVALSENQQKVDKLKEQIRTVTPKEGQGIFSPKFLPPAKNKTTCIHCSDRRSEENKFSPAFLTTKIVRTRTDASYLSAVTGLRKELNLVPPLKDTVAVLCNTCSGLIGKYQSARDKVDKSLNQLRSTPWSTSTADEGAGARGTLKGTDTYDNLNLPSTSSDQDTCPPPPAKKRKVIRADNNQKKEDNDVMIIQTKKDPSCTLPPSVKMKGDSCWYPYCRNKRSKGGDLSFFVFPMDPQRRAEWCRALGMKVSQLWKGRGSIICSDHFEDKYFTSDKKYILKKNAVPKKVPTGGVPPLQPPAPAPAPPPLLNTTTPLHPSITPGLPIFIPPVTIIVCGSGAGSIEGSLVTTSPTTTTTSVQNLKNLEEGEEDPSNDSKKDKPTTTTPPTILDDDDIKTEEEEEELLDIYDGPLIVPDSLKKKGKGEDGDKLEKNPSTDTPTADTTLPTTTTISSGPSFLSVPVPPQQSNFPSNKHVMIAPKCFYQLPGSAGMLYVPPTIPVIPPQPDPPPPPKNYVKENKEQRQHIDRLERQVKRLNASLKLLKKENRRFKKIKDQQKNGRVKKMSRGVQVKMRE